MATRARSAATSSVWLFLASARRPSVCLRAAEVMRAPATPRPGGSGDSSHHGAVTRKSASASTRKAAATPRFRLLGGSARSGIAGPAGAESASESTRAASRKAWSVLSACARQTRTDSRAAAKRANTAAPTGSVPAGLGEHPTHRAACQQMAAHSAEQKRRPQPPVQQMLGASLASAAALRSGRLASSNSAEGAWRPQSAASCSPSEPKWRVHAAHARTSEEGAWIETRGSQIAIRPPVSKAPRAKAARPLPGVSRTSNASASS
mmetsp:Transcript_20466/g.51970  ORF Transcript_20466/g.51970 Transcript_20466/m.51970 type:complete len:264 (+) Transcript_20466:1095-1886(+)